MEESATLMTWLHKVAGIVRPGKTEKTGDARPFMSRGEQYIVLNQEYLDEIIRLYEPPEYIDPETGEAIQKGKLVTGIPFTTPDRNAAAMTLRNPETGEEVSSSRVGHRFSQQSISKTVAHADGILLAGSEPAFRAYVGTEPSGTPFNVDTRLGDGRVPNPHVNNGAIATQMHNHVLAERRNEESLDRYLELIRNLTGNPALQFKKEMAEGEYHEHGPDGGLSNNRVMMRRMLQPGDQYDRLEQDGITTPRGQRERDGEEGFRKYCYACSTQVDTEDLAAMAATLENGGVRVERRPGGLNGKTQVKFIVLAQGMADAVKRAMVMSGSYDESGKVYVKGRTEIKTGVEGANMGTVQTLDGRRIAGATYHPDLNAVGNSGAGLKYLAHISGQQRLLFPSEVADARRRFKWVQKYKIGSLGESRKDMNRRLTNKLSTEDHAAILDGVKKNITGIGAFYIKEAYAHDAKHKGTFGEQQIHTIRRADGTDDIYSVVITANHNLGKVRVRNVGAPADAGSR